MISVAAVRHQTDTTMKNPSLLSLAVVLLVAVSLLPSAAVALRFIALVGDGTSPYVECAGAGVYAANSTYEANRRRLAGLLLAEAAARGFSYTDRAVGYWPNRPQAVFFCTGSGGSPCAACIADAFLEVERECPYHRKASFYSPNCTLDFDEFRIFGTDSSIFEGDVLSQIMASGLIFQAIGFAWLFFLLLQEWRGRKRGTMMHSTSLLSGD